MDQQQLTHLLEKYKAGTCNQDELRELSDWYHALNLPLEEQRTDDGAVGKEMLADFKQRIRVQEHGFKSLNITRYLRVAAALLVGVTLGVVLLKYNNKTSKGATSVSLSQVVKAAHNRFIQLPDGSRIILKAGSQLNYTGSFNLKTREVMLVGEAYFDVKHDKTRPFIIRTGSVSTRVLGTAFNIEAYPNQPKITVTVTRGKVRVEDKTHVLAVLTPDKQMVFNKANAQAISQKIEADDEVKWVKQNLSFDNDAFGSIANKLAERYQASIRFDAALHNCPTTISFSGSETIEEALNILCLTRGASYKKQNGAYIINGEGCSITNK